MVSRVLTESDIHWMVGIFLDDGEMVASRDRFCLALGLTISQLEDIKFTVDRDRSQTHGFLTLALAKWINIKGASATTGKLAEVLKNERFISVAAKFTSMEGEIRLNSRKIEGNLDFLTKYTVKYEKLTILLVQDELITTDSRQNILNKPSDSDRAIKLYSLLMKTVTNGNYEKLTASLMASSNEHIVRKLNVLTLEALQERLEATEAALAKLRTQTVPPGYVYVQLADEKPPQEIWPSLNWTDISSNYAGLFFRVVGGSSAKMSETQDGQAPRLKEVRFSFVPLLGGAHGNPSVVEIPPGGEWSAKVVAGCYTHSPADRCELLQFKNSEDEVYPRNRSMRIWRRD